MAALLVCAGHLRAFLFIDFGEVESPGFVDRLFYLSTGLGHQAVMVFFVLSGYLVGGSVLMSHERKRWSWVNYGLRRLSRLWVVLLPALVLTLALDALGRQFGHVGYDGALHALYSSGPSAAAPADLRPSTFLGNVFFLQAVVVPSFGTNGPLWSLANEFWYYLLFPLIWGIGFVGSLRARILHGLLAAGLIVWLPVGMVLSGLVWLFGVAAFEETRPGVV